MYKICKEYIKYNLYKSLVILIFLYGCESWTILESTEKKIVAFKNKSHRRLLGITYRQIITNVIVKEKIVSLVGNYVPLIAIVKKRKLCWFGHITRHNSLAKTILQGKVDRKISQGRPRLNWMDTICKWKSNNLENLLLMTLNRDDWRSFCYHRSVYVPPSILESRD